MSRPDIYYSIRLSRVAVLALLLLFSPGSRSQTVKPATTQAPVESPKDTLGRLTPRGAVLGLLKAARNRNTGLAALYLNTPLRGPDAEAFASQLAEVIDRRLPARLNEISDKS